MLHGIAEHRGSKSRFFFLRNYLFFLFLFNLLKVVLTFFFIVILAEHALHTVSLLGQLVFCTYTLFGTLKFTMNVAEWLRRWTPDQSSWVPHRRSFFSVSD